MQPRKKGSVWQRKVVNGNKYACKSKLCANIFFIRQRPPVHGKQRTRIHAIVHGRGLVVLTALKKATNSQAFTGDLTRAIDDDE